MVPISQVEKLFGLFHNRQDARLRVGAFIWFMSDKYLNIVGPSWTQRKQGVFMTTLLDHNNESAWTSLGPSLRELCSEFTEIPALYSV